MGTSGTVFHHAQRWVRYTCGRLESDTVLKDIVYNNFPWPESPTDAQKQKIETAAQAVLDARAAHPNASLADLYDPLTMPPNLVKAHQALDVAVDAATAARASRTSRARRLPVRALPKYTSLLPAAPSGKCRKRTGPATV